MPNSGENVRFQLLVNGTVQGTAGMESIGVLSVILDWVRRTPSAAPVELRSHPQFSEADWVCNRVGVELGGLDLATRQNLVWFRRELRPGDEVTIRILAPGEIDPPAMSRCAAEGG